MRKLFITITSLFLCIFFSGWGYKGHKKINQNCAANFPVQMSFLNSDWANIVTLHCSDADNRRVTDPEEIPRHYIDIDNYPEFLEFGRIPQTYDSVVQIHGLTWVLLQGILPWATETTFDSLKNCFQRRDWNRSGLFAADLGHYVGDGHQPLHITRNYNGQYTGQDGIHSRYESKMISKFDAQIVYTADSVQLINDVRNFIFSYIYQNYPLLDSILAADTYARIVAGDVTSETYYQALWSKCSGFTVSLFHHATKSLSDLIYTAWVQAGSPMMYPNSITEPEDLSRTRLLQNFPNPFREVTTIPVEVNHNNTFISLKVYDAFGNLKVSLLNENMGNGYYEIRWDAKDMPDGIYYYVLKADDWTDTRKMVIMK